MLKSMTGYGRQEEMIDGKLISFEIKSVNHKYFECSSRVTRGYLFLENELKKYIQQRITRGKVDVFVKIEMIEASDIRVSVNHSLLEGYLSAFDEISKRYEIQNDASISLISRIPEVFSVSKNPEDEKKTLKAVLQVADKAMESFLQMRVSEGEKLKEDIETRTVRILELVSIVEESAPQTVQAYREKLLQKIQEIIASDHFEEQRVLTEVAIYADKVATDEETVRLRSHLRQMQTFVAGDLAIGRKMDFLVQEMNREVNTIGSKCVNSDMAHLVVEIKSEIEKIREQIQNIE